MNLIEENWNTFPSELQWAFHNDAVVNRTMVDANRQNKTRDELFCDLITFLLRSRFDLLDRELRRVMLTPPPPIIIQGKGHSCPE